MNTDRHQKVFREDAFTTPIHVIGAGATGSKVIMSLAKLGVRDITVYDDDVVESHNIPNQAFGIPDIGKLKVHAIAQRVLADTGIAIKAVPERVEDMSGMRGIILVLTDTMSSRKALWRQAKFSPVIKLWIETRMGADSMRIYCVNPLAAAQHRRYEETLYADEEAEVSLCGASVSVGPTSDVLSGLAVWQVINAANQKSPEFELLVSTSTPMSVGQHINNNQ